MSIFDKIFPQKKDKESTVQRVNTGKAPKDPKPMACVYAGPEFYNNGRAYPERPDKENGFEDVYAGPDAGDVDTVEEIDEEDIPDAEPCEKGEEENVAETPVDNNDPEPSQFMMVYAGPSIMNNNAQSLFGASAKDVDADDITICKVCGEKLMPERKFCHNCGSSVKPYRVCPCCGNNIAADASFCPECGARIV